MHRLFIDSLTGLGLIPSYNSQDQLIVPFVIKGSLSWVGQLINKCSIPNNIVLYMSFTFLAYLRVCGLAPLFM